MGRSGVFRIVFSIFASHRRGLSLFLRRIFMPMILGEIKRYLRDNNVVRVSRSLRDLAYKAIGARESLAKSLKREPTEEEVVAFLNSEYGLSCTRDTVREAIESVAAPVSMSDPLGGDEEELCVMDKISDNGAGEESWIEGIALREAMKQLGEREKRILRLRFFQGRTQMEIADEIGISQAQVSRLEKGALSRIRKQL